MKFRLFPSLACLSLAFSACADPISVDDDSSADAASGGSSSSSGGGLIGSSGGSVSASGGSSSGGSASGGAASGGAASGGSGTGGTVSFDGQCAGKPTYDTWKTGSGQAQGDEVVFICSVAQAACAGATINEPYLFSCNQSHVPNCITQSPKDGSSWTRLGLCSDEGLGGGGS